MIPRRLFLASTLAAVAASMAVAQEDDVLELTIALAVDDANFNVTTGSVFRLAEEFGFYEEHGLDVTYVALDGTPQAAAALQSGDVDAADIGMDAAIRLVAQNDFPIRGIVATSTGSPFLIAAKDDIQSVEDLEGRTYAIADNGSLDHNLTQSALRGMGVSQDAPSYVAIGAPAVRVQALAVGQVDATTVSFGTYGSIEGTEGIHVLMDADRFSAFAPPMSKFLAVHEDTIAEKDEALLRLTEALIDTAREMEAHPERWVEAAVAARPDLAPESIERNAEFLTTRWCINGCFDPAELQTSVDFIYANPDFADVPVLSADQLVDTSYTERALENLGTQGGEGLDARM
ncbi:ABC transporter substrate-binding protein [Pseudoroseicyclus tamaricis]|uniref:ABC transporter substrate-binding protein n=1 Tax=Pseudoroseicyclus tamaricis TaxID=2705421 RepID=A0A6B2K171_9RHOB|nr:ABC transporter substrate-binding protein [Pseudoroseicyclus tamaricis]NDV00076.1 ABC transporter substrate-binding protein [Pseudoroseicyclus tamaricis]